MSRRKSGLREPHKFMFSTSYVLARHLRRYCFENDLTLGEALEEAMVDYLVKVGQIESKDSALVQAQMEK